MSIVVEQNGILTTVQDLGREGYRRFGFSTNGYMDTLAGQLVNLMLNNQATDALLEATLAGPSLYFKTETAICLGGAEMAAALDDTPMPNWQIAAVKPGQRLTMNYALKGARSYIAVKGGLHLPRILGSASTCLKSGLGGLNGGTLQPGDNITIPSYQNTPHGCFYPSADLTHYIDDKSPIRIIPGPQADWFEGRSEQFCQNAYRIGNDSNRMGYRLEGTEIKRKKQQELLTEGVTMGSIQIPADGHPIILMSDGQPTGGYPKIAQVITVDLPRLAQAKPGDTLSFKEITLAQAQQLLLEQNIKLQRLACAARYRWQEIEYERVITGS